MPIPHSETEYITAYLQTQVSTNTNTRQPAHCSNSLFYTPRRLKYVSQVPLLKQLEDSEGKHPTITSFFIMVHTLLLVTKFTASLSFLLFLLLSLLPLPLPTSSVSSFPLPPPSLSFIKRKVSQSRCGSSSDSRQHQCHHCAARNTVRTPEQAGTSCSTARRYLAHCAAGG